MRMSASLDLVKYFQNIFNLRVCESAGRILILHRTHKRAHTAEIPSPVDLGNGGLDDPFEDIEVEHTPRETITIHNLT